MWLSTASNIQERRVRRSLMTTWDSAQAPGAVDFSHSLFPGRTLRDLSSNWFHSQILEGTRPWSSAPGYQRFSAVPQLRSQVKETQLGA